MQRECNQRGTETGVWLLVTRNKLGLYPKSPPIPSFTIPYISPLIQFTWRSEWKRVSEFGHSVHRKDCRFCIVCLLFNNNLKRAAPVVRLRDLSWTLSRKLCINPNSQFTINLYLCCITPWTSSSKINEWMIQLRAPSSGETRVIHLTRDSHSALWGFSSRWVYISCTLVFAVHCGIEWVHSKTSTMVSNTT